MFVRFSFGHCVHSSVLQEEALKVGRAASLRRTHGHCGLLPLAGSNGEAAERLCHTERMPCACFGAESVS